MAYLQKEFNIICNSENAQNVSADGSIFNIALEEPIVIPKSAKNPTVSIENAQIWWTVFNIRENVNDRLTISYGVDVDKQNVVVNIKDGLYDLFSLGTAFHFACIEKGLITLDDQPIFSIIGDDSSQRVIIQINNKEVEVEVPTKIEFTEQSPYEILGFNDDTVLEGNGNYTAPNTARFNTISSFLLKTDLVQHGILLNNEYRNCVAEIQIDVSPGRKIVYSPFRPAVIGEESLIGRRIHKIQMRITDQLSNSVFMTDPWSCRLVIRYHEKIED